MSVSLVRKALEINSDPVLKSSTKHKDKGSRKQGQGKKRKLTKKEANDKLQKQNLKILKFLEPPKPTPTSSKKKKGKRSAEPSQSQQSNSGPTAFTEEDFKKFEAEYFVT